MLKGLTVLHTPELLHTLASMGNGDELALVDCHFRAVSVARRLVRLDGADLPSAVEACLKLLPLAKNDPAARMLQTEAPREIPEVQRLCQEMIDAYEGSHVTLTGITREEFVERAHAAYAVVITGELRRCGCILLKKGVVAPAKVA